jgi:branched-chain amino acid transport system ATP-binding protein
MAAILQTHSLGISFGGLKAVQDLNLTLNEGDLVGLIGPNGAGKTTVFNLLTGIYLPTTGDIIFKGESIVGLKPYQIAAKGITRTFQNIRLFGELSVLENVLIARHLHVPYNMMHAIFRVGKFYQGEKEMRDEAYELLKIMNLAHKAEEKAKNLPYGEQRRLEIARALATHPSLLLLDEPAAGMNPRETTELMELIGFIRSKFNVTTLLIEHDMHLVMNICEQIYVLDYGVNIAHGTPEEIKNNPRVIEAYLGEGA